MTEYNEQYFTQLLKETRNACKAAIVLPHQEEIRDLLQKYPTQCEQVEKAKQAIHGANKKKNNPQQQQQDEDTEEIIQELEETLQLKREEKEDCYKEILEFLKPILQDEFDLASSPELKWNILKCAILHQTTPKTLATYCQEYGPELYFELLEDIAQEDFSCSIVQQMMAHGGPGSVVAPGKWGVRNWCRAYQIYKELRMKIPKNDDYTHCHERLAMAVALQHADPVSYFDQDDVFIDPIERFQHFVQAHRNGELDPAFAYFTVWEYRMIVDCNATEEQMQWGRDYLKRYRPDHLDAKMGPWRYTMQVKTDVGYRQPHWTSQPKSYQQMVSGGGRCGPRAWYGRFINKAHGIPTWGVTQPGHAAMGKWVRSGWNVLLGASAWNHSNWQARDGLSFVAEANARAYQYSKDDTMEEYFEKISLLECVADSVYEETNLKKAEEARFKAKFFWRSLVIAQRLIWSTHAEPKHFQRGPGYDIPDGIYPCKHQDYMARKDKPREDNKIIEESDDTFIIPACAFTNAKGTKAMKCYDGGGQIHMHKQERSVVEYKLPDEIPLNEYELTLKVCTVHLDHEKDPLCITVNDSVKNIIQAPIPYTVGEWGYTTPVKIELGKGDVLKLSRSCGDKGFGLTIKSLHLKTAWVLV